MADNQWRAPMAGAPPYTGPAPGAPGSDPAWRAPMSNAPPYTGTPQLPTPAPQSQAGGAVNMQDGAFDPLSELGKFLEGLFAGAFGGGETGAPAAAAPMQMPRIDAGPAPGPASAPNPHVAAPVPPHRPAALSPAPKGGAAFADPGAKENAWRHPGAGAPPPLPPRRPGAGAMDGWKDPGQIKY